MITPLNLVIADDNRFFCDALKDSLNLHNELNVIATFSNLNSLIEYTETTNFNVLILDVNFNGISSLDHIQNIRKNKNDFKIIALTTLNNNFIKQEATSKGVDCFVGKDTDLTLFKDLVLKCYQKKEEKVATLSKKIQIGTLKFTTRKLEVLQALYKHSDKKEKELSAILHITENSLKTHKRELFEITNTKSTPELIKFGIQNGLIIV